MRSMERQDTKRFGRALALLACRLSSMPFPVYVWAKECILRNSESKGQSSNMTGPEGAGKVPLTFLVERPERSRFSAVEPEPVARWVGIWHASVWEQVGSNKCRILV